MLPCPLHVPLMMAFLTIGPCKLIIPLALHLGTSGEFSGIWVLMEAVVPKFREAPVNQQYLAHIEQSAQKYVIFPAGRRSFRSASDLMTRIGARTGATGLIFSTAPP